VSAKFVRPCIPTTAKAIPRGDAWLHEPKLDGYRFQIVKDGRAVRLYSPSGYDWTKRLASLAVALAGIRCESAVIDGELAFSSAKLLEAAERHGLEGIVSKRQASAYRSGPSRDWLKMKTSGWRAANRERWRLFEKR
jgi:ATP-dependent DNA ligase